MINPLLRQFPPSRLGKLIEPEFIFGKHLQRVEGLVLDQYEDKFNNLSIQFPIRHSKSTYAACVCLWLLLINPEERILIAAFSSTASEDILRKVKDALLAWGPKINRVSIDPKNCRADYFKIANHTGECRAVSIGSRFSQATATTIIVDDIYTEESASSETQRQGVEDWFYQTLLNRRTKSRRGEAKVISTMTPRHPEDVLAKIAENNKDSNPKDKWVICRQAAIADGVALFPELWPLDLLLRKKKELEDAGKGHVWQTVWMCNPVTGGNCEWDENQLADHILYTELPPNLVKVCDIVSCDFSKGTESKTGDDCAIVHTVLDSTGTIWVDVKYAKPSTIPEGTNELASVIKGVRPKLSSCETHGFQESLGIEVQRLLDSMAVRVPLYPYDAGVEKKVGRIRRCLSMGVHRGKVRVKDSILGQRMLRQLRVFPTGEHDDIIDAVAQGVDVVNQSLT